MKRGLLVLVLLAPWLAAVWVGVHNLGQPRQLRLVTSTTPALPVGGWLLLSSSLGMTLGAVATGLLLQTGHSRRRRRWSRTSFEAENSRQDGADHGVTGEEPNPDPWRDTESGLGEPPPILDVPFRLVRPGRTPAPPYNPPAYSADDDDRRDWQPPQTEDW